MNKFVLLIIFCMMLISFLAHPAPVSIEIEDVILITLPFLIMISCFVTGGRFIIHRSQCEMILIVSFYVLSLLIPILIGLLHGVSILNVLRAAGPYINFLPLLMICFLTKDMMNPWTIACILIAVGIFQGLYHLYLYINHTGYASSTMDVLRGRITLVDPRTTIPIILSTSILPFSFFSIHISSRSRRLLYRIMLSFIIFLGFFGATITLTRAIVLSIVVGWLCFFVLYSFHAMSHQLIDIKKYLYNIVCYASLLILTLLSLYNIPLINGIFQGLVTRFQQNLSADHSFDYSNGRIYDEWIPALSTWMESDVFCWLFGIGAGNTFTVATGESRTYIHNLTLYSLIYGGLFGVIACFLLYFFIFKTFVSRAYYSGQMIYYGFASLLMSMFFYSQLFAVHKGLAFNAMLVVILALALSSHFKHRLSNKE